MNAIPPFAHLCEPAASLEDGHGRTVRYIRLSVTDRCNLRCIYCMPASGEARAGAGRILPLEQTARLVGLCAGLIFAALRKAMPKNEKLCCFLGGLAAPVLNTVFFMGFLVLIFYNCEYVQNLANTLGAANAFMFIVLLVGVQAIFEWAICCVVAGAVSLPVRKYLKMN